MVVLEVDSFAVLDKLMDPAVAVMSLVLDTVAFDEKVSVRVEVDERDTVRVWDVVGPEILSVAVTVLVLRVLVCDGVAHETVTEIVSVSVLSHVLVSNDFDSVSVGEEVFVGVEIRRVRVIGNVKDTVAVAAVPVIALELLWLKFPVLLME